MPTLHCTRCSLLKIVQFSSLSPSPFSSVNLKRLILRIFHLFFDKMLNFCQGGVHILVKYSPVTPDAVAFVSKTWKQFMVSFSTFVFVIRKFYFHVTKTKTYNKIIQSFTPLGSECYNVNVKINFK